MVEVAMLGASGWALSDDSKKVYPPSPAPKEDCIEILKQLEFDQTKLTSGAVIKVKGKTLVLVKGSYERLGELASKGMPQDFREVTEGYATEQYYVLGVGYKFLQE